MDGMALDDYIKSQKAKEKGKKPFKPKRFPEKKDQPVEKHRVTEKNEKPQWKIQFLIVQNLPANFQNDSLKALFSKFGELIRCNVLFDKVGESKV